MARFQPLRLIVALVVLIPSCIAQADVERDFRGSCDQIDAGVRAYLNTRGFTEPECPHCPASQRAGSLRAPGRLIDSKGKAIGTLRIRREYGIPISFWIWSTPLHPRVFLRAKPQPMGCRFGLHMDFIGYAMVLGVMPAGEGLGLPSNKKLEAEYLDAIKAQIESSSN